MKHAKLVADLPRAIAGFVPPDAIRQSCESIRDYFANGLPADFDSLTPMEFAFIKVMMNAGTPNKGQDPEF